MIKKIFFLFAYLLVSSAWADKVQVFKKNGFTVKVSIEYSVKGNQFKVVVTDSKKKRLYVNEWIGDAASVKANFLDVNGDGLLDIVLEDWFEDGSMSPTILVNDNNVRFVNANPKNATLDIDGSYDEDQKESHPDKLNKKNRKLYWAAKPEGDGQTELVFGNLRFYDKKENTMVPYPDVPLAYNKKCLCFEVPAKYLKENSDTK